LAALKINEGDIPRFRDAYFTWSDETETTPIIVVHTRTGGGNRDYYESEERCRKCYPEYFAPDTDAPTGPWNADLRALPGYLGDNDCSHDPTYADFRFRVPQESAPDVIKFLRERGKPETAEQKFNRVMEQLNKRR
jgi:hypothetical protein